MQFTAFKIKRLIRVEYQTNNENVNIFFQMEHMNSILHQKVFTPLPQSLTKQ